MVREVIRKQTIKKPVLDFKNRPSIKIISDGTAYGTSIYIDGVRQNDIFKFQIIGEVGKPLIFKSEKLLIDTINISGPLL